jgi:glycogen operon protein
MTPSRWEIVAGDPVAPGAHATADGVAFGVISRQATAVHLCLFDDGGGETRLKFPGRSGDVHSGFVPLAKPGQPYGLRAEGPWDPSQGHRFDATKLLVDPYAVALDRPFAWHPDLAKRDVDTSRLVPRAIVPEPHSEMPPLQARVQRPPGLIYELQVKAFTKLHPKVPEKLRGTVAALAEPCIVEHLQRLGVDCVELMPLAAWIDERHLVPLGLSNAWGYNPITFMAPDPRLAPGGMAEIRKAVDALHAAGIRVLLDVVFNHTGESDAFGPTLSLRGLDNALYFRHAADGTLINDTGTGNTLALDRPPVVALAMDTMRHWVKAAGIDGFRFDLAPVMGRADHGFDPRAPLLEAIEQDPILRTRIMIAEPWDVGPGGYQLGNFPSRWLEWNDSYRDRVRRFWRGDAHAAGDFATAIAGSSDIFERDGRKPSSSVNYVAAHDGFTLKDAVSFATKRNHANGEDNRDGNPREISWEQGGDADLRALLATLFLSRGTPMLTAGDEFGRGQGGNNNAYAQDNATTWLDWEKADLALIDHVAQCATLRRAIADIAQDTFLTALDAEWLGPDGRPFDWSTTNADILGLLLEGLRRPCLWFNRGYAEAKVVLPEPRDKSEWAVAEGSAGILRGEDHAVLPPRAVVVVVEVPSTKRRESRAPDDAAIAALAAAAGIQSEWWEIDGTGHRVSPETQRALLAAMRLDATTTQTARDAMRRLKRVHQRPAPAGGSAYLPEPLRRVFGLTTHLYALRDRRDHGIGDFATLGRFGEATAALGGAFAGINPLHHLFPTDRERASPYQPSDRRFIDPIYIDIDPLLAAPVNEAAAQRLRQQRYVDYPGVWNLKRPVLEAAFAALGPSPELDRFIAACGEALRLHALFEVLAERAGTTDRAKWPAAWRDPASKAVQEIAQDAAHEVRFRAYLQFLCDTQLANAAKCAPGLGLYGDLAVGVARDSGEVWAAPERFAMGVSIGAPPDPFSASGQIWNLPPFIPHVLTEQNLTAFAEILRANMRHFGILRIDHILGLARQFWIPDGASGADGAYVTFPLDDLLALTARESRAARSIVIGEDLGTVPDGLRAKLAAANILSYKLLWFERSGHEFHPPTDYPRLSAACLSSHDLPPFPGWEKQASHAEKLALTDALARQGLPADDLMAAAHVMLARAPSALLLVQADDLAGETEPLNVPGTDRERPNWRRRFAAPTEELSNQPLARRVIAAIKRERP